MTTWNGKVSVLGGPLNQGRRGNLQTVAMIRRIARFRAGSPISGPIFRGLALDIIRSVPDQNHLDEARELATFVQKNVRYAKDIHGVELLHDPLTILEQIRRESACGDCDDMSLLLCVLLISVGIQPFLRVVRQFRKDGHYDHVYVVVYENNWGHPRQRLALDPILKRTPIGYEVPHQSGDEFAV